MKDGIAHLVKHILQKLQLENGNCPDCGSPVEKSERRIILFQYEEICRPVITVL